MNTNVLVRHFFAKYDKIGKFFVTLQSENIKYNINNYKIQIIYEEIFTFFDGCICRSRHVC